MAELVPSQIERMVDIADALERVVEDHPHFAKEGKKKQRPNVDFRSAILYSMLGLPQEMMTAQFAAGRMSGWVSHIHEVATLKHGEGKKAGVRPIDRPRQCYMGPAPRKEGDYGKDEKLFTSYIARRNAYINQAMGIA